MKVYWQTTGQRKEDYFRTVDYFFRYDLCVTNVYPIVHWAAFCFGKLMSSSTQSFASLR